MRSKMSAIGTSDSAFHDGNPSTGELGTIVTADWLNAVQASTMDLQDELLNVLTAASITNNSAVKTQILAAIKYLSNLATFATDTGTVNTYVATLAPALTAYADGVKIRLKILNANTGTSTLNVNGLGAKTIYGAAHVALQSGELVANGYAEFEYVSTLGGFVLLFCTGAAEQITTGSKSQHAATLAQVQSQASSYTADTGAINAYVVNLVPALTSYSDGVKIRVKIANTNTATSLINVNSLGAKTIYGLSGSPLQGGELIAGGIAEFVYSSWYATWILQSCTGAPLQVPSGSNSQHAATLAQVQSQSVNFITDTGAANSYVATLSPALLAYADGIKIRLKIANANTGSSTLNVNGLGAKTIYGAAHVALQSGELIANGYAEFEYSSTLGGFVLLFCTGAPEQIANGSKSQHAVALGQVLPIASMSNFAAYQSSSQSISASTNTAILFQTEVFDDTSEFDNSTGKFTASSAGTYIFNAGVHGNTGASITTCLSLYVNGVERVRLQEQINAYSNKTLAGSSGPVKLAAGDYVQIYYYTTTAESLVVGQYLTYFSGIRVK